MNTSKKSMVALVLVGLLLMFNVPFVSFADRPVQEGIGLSQPLGKTYDTANHNDDRGEIPQEQYAWHFLFLQYTGDGGGTLTVTFKVAGEFEVTAPAKNNETTHFYIGTDADDEITGISLVTNETSGKVNLSHVAKPSTEQQEEQQQEEQQQEEQQQEEQQQEEQQQEEQQQEEQQQQQQEEQQQQQEEQQQQQEEQQQEEQQQEEQQQEEQQQEEEQHQEEVAAEVVITQPTTKENTKREKVTLVTVTSTPAEVQTITIEEETELVLGSPQTAVESQDQDEMLVVDDEVPLGVVTLPKTGDIPFGLFYSIGGMLTATGLFIRKRES